MGVWKASWSRLRPATIIVGAAAALACESAKPDEKPVVQAGTPAAPPVATRIPAASVPPSAMGMAGLEVAALQISRGLQDPAARRALAAALRDPANRPLGIRLSDCVRKSVVRQVLESGATRDGLPAAQICTDVRRRGEFALYMDPRGLRRWGPDDVPAVTAIADPGKPVPRELMAYRTPTVLANVGADPIRMQGPILVIFRVQEPSRRGDLK